MIYFNNYKVRRHLINHKVVFTVREHPKIQGKHDLVYHCKNRGRVKFGEGNIKHIDILTPRRIKERLIDYVDYSGFSTVANWIYVILTINEWKSIKTKMYLYRVELTSYKDNWGGLLY